MATELIEQNVVLLDQAAELLDGLDDALYAAPSAGERGGAGIGPHLRHTLEFYRCFLRDLADGRIDYDRRERDPDLETKRQVALAAIGEIRSGLGALDDAEPSRDLRVRVDVSPGEGGAEEWSRSSLGRELRFLVSHTVHHYALIAQVLRGRGIDPGHEFGVAPATLAYWRRSAGQPEDPPPQGGPSTS